MQVLYDADCGFCSRSAGLLGRLDRAGQLELIPLQEAGEAVPGAPPEDHLLELMHVRDGTGSWSRGGAAWLRIAEVVPALRPFALLARLPFVRPFVEPIYGFVAGNRHRISRLLGEYACAAPLARR
jgi:predicted DCC family thiol-disulfide oxidoreductase YuxK